jgi:hypothetical protein
MLMRFKGVGVTVRRARASLWVAALAILSLASALLLFGLGGRSDLPRADTAEWVEVDVNGTKVRVRGETDGLKITEPKDGTAVQPGQRVRVLIEPHKGFEPDNPGVVVASDLGVFVLKQPPYAAEFTVPDDRLGPIEFRAMSLDRSKYLARVNLSLVSETASPLTKLHIMPDTVGLVVKHGKKQVFVRGEFADGVRRTLDPTIHHVSFQIAHPDIAMVDAAGNVLPIKPGKTRLRAEVGAHVAEAVVVVFDLEN